MATKTQDKPRTRRLFVAGRIRARRRHCEHGSHVGPFFPRPDLSAWYTELGIAGNPEVVDCQRCGSSITLPARAA